MSGRLQGWGTASLAVWLQKPGVNAEDPMMAGNTLTGWLEVWGKPDLGFDPGGGGHARWALVVRESEGGDVVGLVPGCRVNGVIFHRRPVSQQESTPYVLGEDLSMNRLGT